jgi:uncharacterized protein YdeI (YjbR/CyaY-like superfamily)
MHPDSLNQPIDESPAQTKTHLHFGEVEVKGRAEWRAWLADNHQQTKGVWLITYKKCVPEWHLSYDELVEEALCFGWVDSLPRKVDEQRTKIYVAPRKKGSGWSKVNKARIEHLTVAGLIEPPGWDKIHQAQLDGSWAKLDDVEALVMPPDLQVALADHPPAAEYFEAFPRSVKRSILEWVMLAKRPETRQQRILTIAQMAQLNQRARQTGGKATQT